PTARTQPVVKVKSRTAAMTAAATSSGAAKRPSGVRAACWSRQRGSSDLTNSVSTNPGDTEMTRTAGASARASDWVMLSSAALEAQYMTLLPMAVRAAMEEILTTTAPPGSGLSLTS